jgi:hypothetical protein
MMFWISFRASENILDNQFLSNNSAIQPMKKLEKYIRRHFFDGPPAENKPSGYHLRE